MGLVNNRPLREAFERSGLTPCELAWRLNSSQIKEGRWRRADSGPVKRVLGLMNASERNEPQTTVRESTALRYAKALNLDPVDIGL